MKKRNPTLSTREILKNPTFEYIPDIANITQSYFQQMDFHFFGHASVKPDGTFTMLVSDQAWPHEIIAVQKAPPIGFTIYDQIKTRTFFPTMDKGDILGWTDAMAHESKERFNITNPMMLTQKYDDHYEIFVFDFHGKNIYENYVNHFEIFERFIHYYKDKSRKILEKAEKNPLFVSPEYLHLAQQTKQKFLQFSSLNQNHFPAPRRYYLYYQNQEITVSAKEFACLNLLAHGKSLKRIAARLNIGLRTVVTYLERLRKKFNLSSRDELTQVYWENRILSDKIPDII